MPGAEAENRNIENDGGQRERIESVLPEPQAEEETSEISPEEDALQIQDTLREMGIGIVVSAVVVAVVLCLIGTKKLQLLLGVLLGAGMSGLMLWHMYVTIGRAVDMDADSATKYTKKSAVFRLLLAGVALSIALLIPQVFHAAGTLMGLFCLKFAAYFQPLTHKVLKSNKGR
ncbi:MAG: ATP synthase subunit I [Lachnospiraceae bacterium]|nr:ATP synthase subunit I [Lachnospiraceae bacterium]